MKKTALFIAAIVILLTGCKNDGDGQLVGVKDRPNFLDLQPYGMVYVPAGHYLMGAGDDLLNLKRLQRNKSKLYSLKPLNLW